MTSGLWKLPDLWNTQRTRVPQVLGKRCAFSTSSHRPSSLFMTEAKDRKR
jgi:hypothetical protein